MCTEIVLSLVFSCIELVHNSMNNLSSYCGLVDAKIRASDKDLPVKQTFLTHPASLNIFSFSLHIASCT